MGNFVATWQPSTQAPASFSLKLNVKVKTLLFQSLEHSFLICMYISSGCIRYLFDSVFVFGYIP